MSPEKDRESSDYDERPTRSTRRRKRAPLTHTIALLAAGFAAACNTEPEPPSIPDRDEMAERALQPPEDIEFFRDLPSTGVLILTANDAEFNGALETLRRESAGRAREAKLHFSDFANGRIVQATTKVRTYADRDKGRGDHPHGLRTVSIFVARESDFDAVRSLQKRFGIVQLRGHTQDMERLHKKARRVFSDHTLVVLGGCEGTGFIRQFYSPQHPVAADRDIGYTAFNTDMLLRMVDAMGVSSSWTDFYDRLAKQSQEVESRDFVVPGTPGYEIFYRE